MLTTFNADLQCGVEQATANGMKLFSSVLGTNQSDIEVYRDLLGGTPAGWGAANELRGDAA